MEVTVIDKLNTKNTYSLQYGIGDIVKVTEPVCALLNGNVCWLFGIKDAYHTDEFYSYPKGLKDKAWKVVKIKAIYNWELCILLVSRANEYAIVMHTICKRYEKLPIEVIRKGNAKLQEPLTINTLL